MSTSTSQSTPTSPTAQRVKSLPRVLSSPLRPTTSPSTSTVVPSNSRRSSLGVGQTPGTKTPAGPLAKTRARDLLRKHYGLGVGPPTPLPGRSNDPMDLDSTDFDAKSYYEQLITTSSLPALLKRENDLLTEIRQLDGERQSLVYNHHHELIAASDTIAAMKTRAEGLDVDLDLLKAAFSEISRLGAKVSVEKHPSDINSNQ
ncbi:Vps51/Vps67-domain-containing protein [Suillus ampliporus]|nr:Vps51/Vps67-domain-containing protein [Suillus ampliporus]